MGPDGSRRGSGAAARLAAGSWLGAGPGSWACGWALAGWAPGCAARWYSATTGAV